jgi:hypothetical protein
VSRGLRFPVPGVWAVLKCHAVNGSGKVGYRSILLRADVDYALAEANTTYGIIGVKVWIFNGEVLDEKEAVSLIFSGDFYQVIWSKTC